MSKLNFLKFFAIILLIGLYPVTVLSDEFNAEINAWPTEFLKCGPNSLYMFLQLSGQHNVAYGQVETIPILQKGTSLLVLRDSARKFGINSEVFRYRTDDIDSLPLPAIVQFKDDPNELQPTYHFNVIYKVDKRRFYWLDGTTGFEYFGLKSGLSTMWTGYALVEPKSFWKSLITGELPVTFGICLLLVYIPVIITLSSRLKRFHRECKVIKQANTLGSFKLSLPILFLFMLFTIQAELFASDDKMSNLPWRSPANGGINVLYCYLTVNGVPCKYTELLKQQISVQAGSQTAGTLARLAAINGLALQPDLLTFNQLFKCAMPVIVHIDGKSPESGAFILLIGIDTNLVSFLNGPSATIEQMTREDFRRVWSGIALLPESNRRQNVILFVIGIVVGFALPLAFTRTRLKGDCQLKQPL
jgi:predicted double-glycine peptidase